MNIKDFVTESNRIEGINRAPTKAELNAHAYFVDLPAVFAEVFVIMDGKVIGKITGLTFNND